MTFSEKLYQLRIKNGLSQKKLAEAIGVSQASINYWEKGQRKPSFESVFYIAKFFNVIVDSLLDDSYDDVIIEKQPLDTKVCENILKLRKMKNISQEELSEMSGIPVKLIYEYENKIRIPKNKNLIKLASVLDPIGSELLGADLPFALYSNDDGDNTEYKNYNLIAKDKRIRISEYHILESFRQLNELGKEEAEKRVAELTEIKKYIQ